MDFTISTLPSFILLPDNATSAHPPELNPDREIPMTMRGKKRISWPDYASRSDELIFILRISRVERRNGFKFYKNARVEILYLSSKLHGAV